MPRPEIVIAAGRRTPLGRFNGALRDVPFRDQAAHAVRASLAAAALAPAEIDHFVFSTTVPTDSDSLFAARVVSMHAGLPEAVPALCVTRACASGLQALISAAQQIECGQSHRAVAAGAEVFSRVPHVAPSARQGTPRGPLMLEDMLDWAYRCPFSGAYMGETAEALADDFGYTRAAMDDFAATSQARAVSAQASGFLARQIAPIDTPAGPVTQDEGPRADATPDRLSRLRPAFRDGGRVTAGNSSGVTDGAAAMIVAARDAAGGLGPALRLVDWVAVGVEPRIMGHGPVPAITALLERTGLRLSQIDYFEINEAFAVVNLHAEARLGIPRDRHNLHGGGISLGHPPAVTGLRMAMTALHHLHDTGGRYAVLSMCLGAGQGMALLVEAVTV